MSKTMISRAEEAGIDLEFYAAALVDVSPVGETDNPMADYAFHGIEVVLRPETRFVPIGVDHACSAHTPWMVTIDDKGRLYKCGGKSAGRPEFAYATARDWDPGNPFATAYNPDMLSKYLNTASPAEECSECVWLPLCGGGCPHLRLFGKHGCPPYRYDPEAFVLAMHARMREQNNQQGKQSPLMIAPC